MSYVPVTRCVYCDVSIGRCSIFVSRSYKTRTSRLGRARCPHTVSLAVNPYPSNTALSMRTSHMGRFQGAVAYHICQWVSIKIISDSSRISTVVRQRWFRRVAISRWPALANTTNQSVAVPGKLLPKDQLGSNRLVLFRLYLIGIYTSILRGVRSIWEYWTGFRFIHVMDTAACSTSAIPLPVSPSTILGSILIGSFISAM